MRVLIVDDHQLFVDGITRVLNRLTVASEVYSANSIRAAQEKIRLLPDLNLILLDLNLPGLDGISLLRYLKENELFVPVIVVSAADDVSKIREALESGAVGFVPKSYSSNAMLLAIQKVLAGERYLPDAIQAAIVEQGKPGLKKITERAAKLKELGISRRQFKVLERIAMGESNAQAANALSVSEHTIKSHVAVLFKALNVASRIDCILEANRMNLIDL